LILLKNNKVIDFTFLLHPVDAKVSQISFTQADFVLNFVAMATWVGRGKMQLAAFNGPSPKTPL